MGEPSLSAQAEERAAAGEPMAALALCRAALAADPGDRRALRLAVELELQTGGAARAVALARDAAGKAPQDLACRRILVRALAGAGKAEAALAEAEAVLARHPDTLWFRSERGQLLSLAGRGDEAVAALAETCAAAPRHPGPLTYLALAEFRRGRPQPAIEAARRALELGEARARPLAELGKLLLDAGAVPAARTAFERAIRTNRRDLDSCSGLSRACALEGDLAAARDAARELFRRQPVFRRATRDSQLRVLVLEYLYDGFFTTRRYGPQIFQYLNFVSGLEPGRLALHHYYLNRDDPAADVARLGGFDVVLNNLSNGERVAALGLAPMLRSVIEVVGAPVVNAPEAVLATTRAGNARRLQGARRFVFPRTVGFEIGAAEPRAALGPILAEVPLPLVLRPTTTHAGVRAVLVSTEDELAAALDGFAGTAVYAIAFHECRDAEGVARRYRLIGVGGALVGVNMHASHHWNVHGDERTDGDWKARGLDRAERAFLEDPASLLGSDPVELFRELTESAPLDIYGFDFGVALDGRVVVYELNASMSFSTRRLLARYPYLRPYKLRSQQLIEDHIVAVATAARAG